MDISVHTAIPVKCSELHLGQLPGSPSLPALASQCPERGIAAPGAQRWLEQCQAQAAPAVLTLLSLAQCHPRAVQLGEAGCFVLQSPEGPAHPLPIHGAGAGGLPRHPPQGPLGEEGAGSSMLAEVKFAPVSAARFCLFRLIPGQCKSSIVSRVSAHSLLTAREQNPSCCQ